MESGMFMCLGVLVAMVTGINGQTMDDVYNLHHDLIKTSNYSKHIRPAVDQSKPTVVNITFDLVSIRELDEITGKLSIVGIIWMSWEDPRLSWNPADYGMAMKTHIDMAKVWKPDLVIAHPIDAIEAVGFEHYHYPIRYYPNGVAVWAPGDVMTTTCKIDVTYYPFDTQKCEVMFMHWGSLQSEIALKAAQTEISTKFFVSHGVWQITDLYAKEGLIDNAYPTYNVVLHFKRRPTFIIVNVVLPILFMGLLNVLVFFLPAQSGERVSYSITVLLAIAVFLTLVGDNMPKTSEPMSTICYFLLTNLVMSSMIMMITILNLNIFHMSNNRPVPVGLVNFVKILRCQRTNSKVEDFTVSDDEIGVHEIDGKAVVDEKHDIETKWATPPIDDRNTVTWQDVSRMIDKICGLLAAVWLFFSAAAFFGMVSTQTVPGV